MQTDAYTIDPRDRKTWPRCRSLSVQLRRNFAPRPIRGWPTMTTWYQQMSISSTRMCG